MRRLVPHIVVLVLALGAAFAAYRHARRAPAEGTAEEPPEVVAANIERRDLSAVRYESETRTVVVELGEGQGPSWITVTTRTKRPPRPRPEPSKAPAPDGGAADGARDGGPEPARDGGAAPDGGPADAAPAAEPEPEVRVDTLRFVANEELDGVLDRLAPLKVVRRLGKIPTKRLADFDLDEPEATLTLELRGSEPRVLKLGGRTYGGGDNYALDQSTGEVYLMASAVVRDLEMAQARLMQRRLHRFEEGEARTAVVTAGGASATLEAQNGASPEQRTWVIEGRPEASEQAANWMRQLERLRALSFPAAEEQPRGEPTPLFRVELRGEGGHELGFVEVIRTGEGPTAELLARSEATAVWVRLARTVAEDLAEDVAEVVGSPR